MKIVKKENGNYDISDLSKEQLCALSYIILAAKKNSFEEDDDGVLIRVVEGYICSMPIQNYAVILDYCKIIEDLNLQQWMSD